MSTIAKLRKKKAKTLETTKSATLIKDSKVKLVAPFYYSLLRALTPNIATLAYYTTLLLPYNNKDNIY